jgi:hypothetical protein
VLPFTTQRFLKRRCTKWRVTMASHTHLIKPQAVNVLKVCVRKGCCIKRPAQCSVYSSIQICACSSAGSELARVYAVLTAAAMVVLSMNHVHRNAVIPPNGTTNLNSTVKIEAVFNCQNKKVQVIELHLRASANARTPVCVPDTVPLKPSRAIRKFFAVINIGNIVCNMVYAQHYCEL